MCRGHVRARACVCECVCVRGSSWWVCPQGTIPKEAQNFTSLWPSFIRHNPILETPNGKGVHLSYNQRGES